MTASLYLDSSAFVKLFTAEPERSALVTFVRERELTSSALLRTEAPRGVRHLGADAIEQARTALATVTLIRVSDAILDRAGMLDPTILRSLDAIHVATALSVADDIDRVVTYDQRMQHASRTVGFAVESPA
jgi:uncharacterized protein